jgi:Polyketide cyclase / dehydrase and lipid transport
MLTIEARSETRSISIAAEPHAVLAFLADPRQLPVWAPNFAESVRQDGGELVVSSGEDEIRIRMRVSHEHGTVDLLAAKDPRIGAFSRVIPNGGGSEYLFTLLFADGTPRADIDRQMSIVEEELQAVRAHCE